MNQAITTAPNLNGGSPDKDSGLRPLVISGAQWKRPLIFMLTLSLCGLKFYPAFLFLLIILVNSFRTDRYEFMVMLMLSFGSYGITTDATFFVKGVDLILVVGVVLFLTMYKTPLVRRLSWLWLGYVVALIFIASHSAESMRIQLLSIRFYAAICCFIIPVALFAGRPFSMPKLFEALMPFALLMCGFYAIDALILKGNILVPRTFAWGADSSFFHPVLDPLSTKIFRKYPPGMLFVAFAAYPVLRYYRLSAWQWTVIVAGILSTQTFIVITGFTLLFCFTKGLGKYVISSIGLFVALIGIAYAVDSMLPIKANEDGTYTSTLRIKSSVMQFSALSTSAEVEDIARFGSGRMAQLIPNLELINSEHRELYGLGFIHPDYSNIARYKIVNVFFSDIANNEIMAGVVEINPAQVYVYAGIAGLIVVYGFYGLICRIIHKCRYKKFFYYALFLMLFFSLGNYAYINGSGTLITLGFSLGAVCLANRPPEADYINSSSNVLQH